MSIYSKINKDFKNYPFRIALKFLLSRELITRLSFFIPNKYLLIKYFGGKIYLNLKESHMVRESALGIFEYWKIPLFKKLIKPNMTVIDVGVNKGYYTLFFAKLINDKGKVLSFEPVPNNCHWVKESIKANKYTSIKLFQLALSDSEGAKTFFIGKKSGWGSLIHQSKRAALDKEPIVVKTKKLDDVLADEGIDDIDVIKIDVEGGDLLVLKGAENLFRKSKKVKLLMDVDVQSESDKRQLFNLLSSWGFVIYKIGKHLKRIEKIDETVTDIYATKESDTSQ